MASRQYQYVGPDEIRKAIQGAPLGKPIYCKSDLSDWLTTTQTDTREEGCVIATFVVGIDQVLRLAPRRSEHVACAGGASVLSAGEITISRNLEVDEVTNQSTGYCPEPESWTQVAQALDNIGVSRPDEFTTQVIFRKCVACGQRNIVKDNWYCCEVCQARLTEDWNFSDD